jgi:orotidine-5'-phosphate decarboxylase
MTKQQLTDQIFSKKTYLCVGLDTDTARLPSHLGTTPEAMTQFNKAIIDATKDYAVAYKINTAFYEAEGLRGWQALEETVNYIPRTHFKIADAKRGDIGNTSAQYAKAFFKTLNFDAVTVAPYMGADSIRPFLEYEDKWTIVLGLTSNAGAADFELQRVIRSTTAALESSEVALDVASHKTEYLYERVIRTVSEWGRADNLMFVVGATQADAFSRIRNIVPEHFFLVPGVGAQGGSLQEISEAAMTRDCGILVNASRAVIYASQAEDFAEKAGEAASTYQKQMEHYLNRI